jgi:polar amino acid transport system permease protein
MSGFFSDWGAHYAPLLSGLWISVRLAALSLVVGMPCGLLLALAVRTRPADPARRVLRAAVIVIVELGRGTPSLVILQLIYYGLPSAHLTFTSFVAAAIGLGFTTAVYTSEIIRGGLQAVPDGQREAADALGLAHRDTLRYIVIPQGIRLALPPLMGFAVLIFQATALAYTIALPEMLSQAYQIGSSTFRYLSILVLAGLFYAAITIPVSLLTERAEERLSRHV